MNSKLLSNIASTLIAVGRCLPTLSAPEPLLFPRPVVAVTAKRASFSIRLRNLGGIPVFLRAFRSLIDRCS